MRVRIQNFQSIRDVEFEVEGFTAIIGPSSIGKSAIYRALNYPLHNRLGDGFVRWGEQKARVEVEDEDFKMVWEKGSGGATYYFNDDPIPVEKTERGVIPQQIIDAGWSDVILKDGSGKVKERISAQFAPQKGGNVFLLDDNPTTVAEVLAQLSRLEVLMKAARTTETDIRRIKSTLKIRVDDEKRLQAKRDTYEGLTEAQAQVQAMKARAEELRGEAAKVGKVEGIQERLDRIQETLRALKPLSKVSVPQTLDEDQWHLWKRAEGLAKRHTKAVGVLQVLSSVKAAKVPALPEVDTWTQAAALSKKLSMAKAILSQKIPELPPLPDASLWEKVEGLHEGVLEQREEKASLQQLSRTTQGEIEAVEEEIAELERLMGTCPTCGKAFHG